MFLVWFGLIVLCAGIGFGLLIALYMDARAYREEQNKREAWQTQFRTLLAERQKLREQERSLRKGQAL